jgi:hypothetical protein
MPLTKIVAANAAEYAAHFAAASAAGRPVFALFTGAAGDDGKSWCPDCSDAKPLLDATFAEGGRAADLTLIEVPLVRAEYKGNASHWARTLAGVKLERIPTLMKMGAKGKIAELVEGDCNDVSRVRELVLDELCC